LLKVPSHISKTKNGIYYFRLVIPKRCRQFFKYKREFTRTLQTEDKRTAVKRARVLMVEMDKVLAFLEAKKRGENPSQSWMQLKNVKLKDGSIIEELTIDDSPELEAKLVEKVFGIHEVSAPTPVVKLTLLLSEIIEKYCDEKKLLKAWTEKSAIENRATFDLFIRIVGDEVFSALEYAQLQDLKPKFLKLPANINKVKRYKDKTIEQVLQMDDVKPMARNTQNKHLNRIHSLFLWAVKHGYTDKNYATGLPVGKDKNPLDARYPFSNADLKELFESQKYKDNSFHREYQYWVPLIALYTGARLNEICQLHLKDIKLVNGIYIFDFNEGAEDQRVKTNSSNRETPIHSKLIDLGLITYINQLKLIKETRLFPELKKNKNGSYSRRPSDWFREYRKEQGVHNRSKKVFHSFRHTVIDHLKQKKVTKEIIAAIVGHGEESVTFGVYGSKYKPEVLEEYIEMLDYDVEFTKFHQD